MSDEQATLVIRFAGDSGDGMQVVGSQFTETSAELGNDLHTFPDFPAEIRAPAGTLAGVSGFQVSISEREIHTPGDSLDALVAMNPAALKANLADLKPGGLLILNQDSFIDKELKKAGYASDPMTDGSLTAYQCMPLLITQLTLRAVEQFDIPHSQAKRCKNMFALGVVYWLFQRPLRHTEDWLQAKFVDSPEIAKANQQALIAGYAYGEASELFSDTYCVGKAELPSGEYRQITGNEALALACVAAATQSQRNVLLASYPITPASTILHQVAKYADYGVQTFQAEDEIAAVSAAIGAAYGGQLAVTTTSGPGLDLKAEAIGLAVMTELPLVVIDVQRAGPSTGMPTKTEQSDLLAAMYGRHGDNQVPILAPATPGECFTMLLEAFRIAIKYMTPVILLSDGYLAMGAEPWLIPDVNKLPDLQPHYATAADDFSPYQRDPETLARAWAIPGTKGLEHRIGGIEKADVTGQVSYDPENHAYMTHLRSQKIAGIADDIAALEVIGEESGDVLMVSWGGTYGACLTAVEQLQAEDVSISLVHLRYLNPFPKQLKTLLNRFKRVVVPELNAGQLCQLLRSQYLIDAQPISKISGKPFLVSELVAACREVEYD